MGSYKFRWEHPAEEVFVTGTFDDWKKSTKLDKVGTAHEKTVDLPKSDDKILYKFVADGDWKHDPTAKTEQDHEGNTNNVLYPDDIKPSSLAGAAISSVGPGASTLAMAGEQPKSTPGAFPETPAESDDQTFSVNPIPATGGTGNPITLAPGAPVPASSTVTGNTITSGVHDDPELKSKDAAGEQTFGVAPLPATGGIGNPIQLAPGEKVPEPSSITGNTVQSTATTDQASYERSDASAAVVQPNAGTLQDRVVPATAVFGGPGPVIPESGMSMGNTTDISKEDIGPTVASVGPGATTTELAGQQPIQPRGEATVISGSDEAVKNDPTMSSVAPGSTTAALAGQQPLEQRGVPEVVSESQQEAKADPEASANPAAVEEKKEVEDELKKEVPEAPSTSESGLLGKSEDGIGAKAAAGAAAAGVAVAGAAVAANEVIKDKTGTDPKSALPESVQNTMDEKAKDSSIPQKATESSTDAARETTTTVPTEVIESQKEAGEPAEASASPEAVKEKSALEQELLSKVPESEAKGEPAPTDSAATATSAPAATSANGAPQLSEPTAEGSGDGGRMADRTPTPMDSRDVSPMSRPATQDPSVTTGVATSSTPAKSEPAKSAAQKRQSLVDKLKAYKPDSPESSNTSKSTPATSESKKKENRRSFFGKIKDKLKYDKQEATADEVANGPKRDKGKGRAVGDDIDNANPDQNRNVDLQPPTILPALISSPPPFLPPRKSKSKASLDPTTLPPPFIPPATQYWQPPAPRQIRQPRLQLPQSSDEASIISRGNARAQRHTPSVAATEPIPSDPPSPSNQSRHRLLMGSLAGSSSSRIPGVHSYPPSGAGEPSSSTSLETNLTAPSSLELARDWDFWHKAMSEED